MFNWKIYLSGDKVLYNIYCLYIKSPNIFEVVLIMLGTGLNGTRFMGRKIDIGLRPGQFLLAFMFRVKIKMYCKSIFFKDHHTLFPHILIFGPDPSRKVRTILKDKVVFNITLIGSLHCLFTKFLNITWNLSILTLILPL